jgi:flagellar biosynthesis/type III secretory pathway protein FliH
MKSDTLAKQDEKYFFNANIFDDDGNVQTRKKKEPPPVFTLEQLEAIKQDSLREGKQTGLKEAQESREQLVTAILKKISQDIALLLQAEEERERAYQEEAVHLTLQIFQKLFPVYNEKHGFDELVTAMTAVLKKQEGQKQIRISVAAGMKDAIEAHVAQIQASENGQTLAVKADEALPEGAFVLSWSDGGAVRDAAAMAAEIESLMGGMIAAKDNKSGPADQTGQPEQEKVEKPDE